MNIHSRKQTKIEGLREKEDFSSIKTLDFGTVVGASVDWKIPAGIVNFDFRISYSLINMMDPVEGYLVEFNKTKFGYERIRAFRA